MDNENETVEQVCEHLLNTGRYYYGIEPRHIKALENYVNLILAAHKRELAAKDAEIARLKRENFDINGCLLAEQESVEKRNALITKLADILKITSKKYFECEERMCAFCGKKCGRNEATRLIKEAREVCK